MAFSKLVTPKAGAKHELLLNKLASTPDVQTIGTMSEHQPQRAVKIFEFKENNLNCCISL
jgi:hypothetical protein